MEIVCDASVRLSRPIQPANQLFCFWPCPSACGILVPQTGIELMSSALEVYSPNHWTARKSCPSPTFGSLFPPTPENQEDLTTCGRCLLCPPSRTWWVLLPQPKTSFSIQSLSSLLVTVPLSPSPWSLYNHWSPSWPTFSLLTLKINPAWVSYSPTTLTSVGRADD